MIDTVDSISENCPSHLFHLEKYLLFTVYVFHIRIYLHTHIPLLSFGDTIQRIF